MKSQKVSIIVPVYNTENYIDECIASIVKQSHKNIEIVIVDDCSPDGAVAIAKKWQERDSRIKIVSHDKNKGLPAARNTGLSNATGDYIRHVDSDDVIPHNSTERLLSYALKSGSDVICGNMARLTEDGVRQEAWLARYMEEKVGVRFEDDENLWPHLGNVVSYLFKADFTAANELQFCEDITYGEDQVYVSAALPKASSITYCPAVTYFYRDNAGSMTYTLTEKKVEDEMSWPLKVKANLADCPQAYFHTLLRSSRHRLEVLEKVIESYSADKAISYIQKARDCYLGFTPADLFTNEAAKLYPYFRADTAYKLMILMSDTDEKVYTLLKEQRVNLSLSSMP
jgi:glycosyltransferase involved in cell wall biosynthesis